MAHCKVCGKHVSKYVLIPNYADLKYEKWCVECAKAAEFTVTASNIISEAPPPRPTVVRRYPAE